MPKGSGGEPSWWSSGEVPDELPTWARRGLEESPTRLTPSAPVAEPGRRRRRAAAAAAGTGTTGRLRGWGLAAASVAAAAAVVPAAISTLAGTGDNTALPRVGTFPVVAPGDLPGQGLPPTVRRVPGTSDPSAAPGAPADASVLPPMDAPSVTVAGPPRPVTITPRALARDDDEDTSTTTRPSTDGSTTDDDDGGSETPTPRGDDDDDAAGGGGSGGTSGGSSGGGSGSSGSGSAGGSGGSSGSSGSDGSSSRRGDGSLVGGLTDTVGGVARGVGRTVNGLVG